MPLPTQPEPQHAGPYLDFSSLVNVVRVVSEGKRLGVGTHDAGGSGRSIA